MSAVIYTLANYRAKKQVREQLRRHGVKVSSVPARELIDMTKLWFDIHRDECIADAWKMVGQSAELRKVYEKEQRQRAKLSSAAQSKIEPLSVTSSVQISGAK